MKGSDMEVQSWPLIRLFVMLIWGHSLLVSAKTHVFNFTTGWVTVNPDGMGERQMIGFNGEWPLPDIHINKGDRVELYLTNGFDNLTTSLHYHGLFMSTEHGNSVQMDGPEMVTQCPIQPGDTFLYNFTVPDQVGTYWYHSHSGSQYTDGMRGAFVVHDPNAPFEYDEDMTILVSDLYDKPYYKIMDSFLSRYNPTGAEPIPRNVLFNHTTNYTMHFDTDKTYLIRLINGGTFVSQYFFIEDHDMTIVEIDGTYVQPTKSKLIYIAAGQRMSILVKSKHTKTKNFAFMQIIDESMLDVLPPELQLNRTNTISYDSKLGPAKQAYIDSLDEFTNDFDLIPLHKKELLHEYDYQIKLNVEMENLGDGIQYAFFNNITYVAPKVPTLLTALSAGELATNAAIYGDNINAFVLEHGEVVEVVVNNHDSGRHPFHMHGHIFQVVQKSEGKEDGEEPIDYDEKNPVSPYPDYPILRDTVVVEPLGHVVLRFKATNPGVWLFHCHVDWHLEQGLAAVFIEAPLLLQEKEELTASVLNTCKTGNIPVRGNAVGDEKDWFNMNGLPKQPGPLPKGFTFKGYFAFILSTLVGVWGIFTITKYGLGEVVQDEKELLIHLKSVLENS
ncbi:iron transport multicopper oxidase FET5 [Kluyveromyces marxianus]|nr:iron transport multicopper oxidase FET5 [Kluyveromyces marxianus]